MKLTKLEHSGIVLEKDGKRLVFDPVEFAETLPEFNSVAAIVITHVHSDHLQPEQISAILDRNPEAKIFAPEDAAMVILNALGAADVTTAVGGDKLTVGGFEMEFFGKDHASVVAGKVPCQNIGVVVGGKLTNPGDSFDLLEMNGTVETLLVPEVAPWSKMSETMEFVKIAKPQIVIPVHNGLLSEMGQTIYNNLLRGACEEVNAKFIPLGVDESIEI